MRHGQQTPRAARMAGDEDQISLRDSLGRPFQIIVEVSRLVVLVYAEEGDIEIVPGKGEVVGIAPEKRDIKLRREHQPHISVLLILVQVVNLSGIENHDVAAQSRAGSAVFLDLRHSGALRCSGFRR